MAAQFSEADGKKWKTPFFTIWVGQALSLLGSQLVQFALIWHLTITTGSATVLAVASLVGLLPTVIFGPVIGTLVDRWNRRVIMAVADTVIALATVVLAVLFASNNIQIWHIYTLMFIRSIGGAFHGPAMGASTSLMVPKEHFARIQGINQTLNGGLNIISAPLGALLLELIPMQGILAIDVVSALFAIVPLFFISIPQPERIESGESEKTGVWEDTKIGIRYVLSWPGMLILIGMAMLINFLFTPAGALMPLLVTDHFGGGVVQLGWFEATFGIGVIIGGLGLGVWGGFKRRAATAMLGITGLGTGFIILGLLPGTGFNLALGAAVLAGIMIPIANGAIGAIFQASVPPDMQGRVFTLVGSGASAMAPVGLIIGGPVADAFGVQSWFLIGGLVCASLGVMGFFIPALMNIDQELNENSEVEAHPAPAEVVAAD